MRVGLALPQFDYSLGPNHSRLPWATVVDWAQRAESLGFDSVWMADHLFLDTSAFGGPESRSFGYDPIIGLGALARGTNRVGLGTLVLCAQLRPPKLLARQLDALQKLADGRLVAGFGAGWYEPEFREAGIPFESPGRRLAQLAGALEAVADHVPKLPRWVGGKGDRLLRLVARHADGWNAVWAWTPEAYEERVRYLDRACEAIGRDPQTVTLSLGLYALVGEDEADLARRFELLQTRTHPGVLSGMSLDQWRQGRLVGTVEEVREQLERWRDLGVVEVIAGTGAVPFSVNDPGDLDLLASALLS
jgi:alkanesulfonate monooxygenase SsuD/methylene tetrahydromethanopterin reductase-like flavin-dependent oxidoreductase (luciferase family)